MSITEKHRFDADADGSLPVGLTVAFAQNTDAFVRFTALSPAEQDELIDAAKQVKTKRELLRLIDSIKYEQTRS